jgi:ATP-dependent Clp protease ATP-binding subunit ClpA
VVRLKASLQPAQDANGVFNRRFGNINFLEATCQRAIFFEDPAEFLERGRVEDIVAKIARIPPKHVNSSDKELLRNLERDLKLTVFGQDAAIDALSTAIKLSRAEVRVP